MVVVVVVIQANLHMTDSMGPGKLVHHTQSPLYTYETDISFICMELGPSISSVIAKSLAYSDPPYASLPVVIVEVVVVFQKA